MSSDPSRDVVDESIDAAVDQAVGALIFDKDVSEILALEGGFLEVLRRGRRERLHAVLEGPLFSLLRERVEARGNQQVSVRLRGGQRLVCGPLVDGRIGLRLEKSAAIDATLERLVEEGVLPPGIPAELCAAVLDGAGLLVLGPSRAGRQRVLAAVIRALQQKLAWFGVSDALAALVPVPRAPSVIERARAALVLGADALCALDVTPNDVGALASASLGVPLACSVTSSSMDSLQAILGLPVAAVAGQSAVIASGPDGRPRLFELHGPVRSVDESALSLPSPASGEGPGVRGLKPMFARATPVPAEVSGLRERPRTSSVAALPGPTEDALPPLPELPSAWASDDTDNDPGWELGEPAPRDTSEGSPAASTTSSAVSPGPGVSPVSTGPSRGKSSFDDALLAQRQKKPSFAPKPPPAHPQTAALRGDPFGGLTFEPPPGGPPADEGDVDPEDEE